MSGVSEFVIASIEQYIEEESVLEIGVDSESVSPVFNPNSPTQPCE